jgi:hypothetical protein
MKNHQIWIASIILGAAMIVSALILAEALEDAALHLVRVLQLK